ncbi:hypothetical protein N7495_006399 [Penicillium taxi]|uniref:uncharacterized protein n=1 Tax=Penicillium taxi TaxID=168475 RepID=UPI00254589F5|nr:uncharacterized protein N7495_006399 [Penicillium taxi]KAJ5894708.1 hypothetical protein N7495_006399 [Penicillium taxi]
MKVTSELPVRVLTHNIRYDTSAPFKGERPWPERQQLLFNELNFHTRHNDNTFICLQEVLVNQLEDINRGLCAVSYPKPSTPRWKFIGVGRDDGYCKGEFSPIFYQPSVWKLLHEDTVWLSKTPSKPSKSWDAASNRIVTIGVFIHRPSGRGILAMNTHLDDQGSRSRLEAARIIHNKIKEYREVSKWKDLISGTFLAGDLNSQETEEAYKELTSHGHMRDTYMLVDASYRYGNHNTFTGFGYEEEPPSRIDYVLLHIPEIQKQTWKVNGYSVLPNQFDDGVFNSDHCAVVADLTLVD